MRRTIEAMPSLGSFVQSPHLWIIPVDIDGLHFSRQSTVNAVNVQNCFVFHHAPKHTGHYSDHNFIQSLTYISIVSGIWREELHDLVAGWMSSDYVAVCKVRYTMTVKLFLLTAAAAATASVNSILWTRGIHVVKSWSFTENNKTNFCPNMK